MKELDTIEKRIKELKEELKGLQKIVKSKEVKKFLELKKSELGKKDFENPNV